MSENKPIDKIQSELQEGMSLSKCRKCGCMKETMENLRTSTSSMQTNAFSGLLVKLNHWLSIGGAIAYAFATYNIIILEAGHITKLYAIGVMPAVSAGMMLIYNQKNISGEAYFY